MADVKEIMVMLESLGLTKTEATLYIVLLKKGTSTGYRIAKEAGIYKANTYLSLENLARKNLVLKKEINGKLYFDAVAPESLLKNLDIQKEKLQALIPSLQLHFKEEMEDVSVFTGINAFFQVLYQLLDQNDSIYAYDIPSYVPEIVKNHIMSFHRDRIKKKVKMYHIYDYDARDRIALLSKMRYTYAKQGFKDRLSLTSTIVCGNATFIVNWKKSMKTVRITDKDVAETARNQFSVLWNAKA